MQTFYLIYFFVTGTVFGSFFNVVGLRVPNKQLFQSQRSYCPHCSHTLRWYELIPILSFILQFGRCRHCKRHISSIYPIIEFMTGVLFAYSFLHFGFQIELLLSLLLLSLLSIIVVSDTKYMLIPDKILLFFLPLFIILRFIEPLDPWWSSVFGAVVGFGLLAIIIIVSRGGMGGGDMKLFGLLGIVLGISKVLVAFFLATLIGAIVSGILVGVKLVDRKKAIPFGPYIVIGTIVAYFFGDKVIDWYLSIFF
ncbi:prepilin peptidase [Aquibacillus albus]|uniref:Leader peptidase (Prepilin peptidase)/N-methyltransferase n=1 Tax=Aquibacillus albus TaxID=1168171 RepID=A0ABS2N1K6_9BACI|nr:A24 family peptidase [Aquibacillus albus]MBM7572021.1 leader peptidase (prepilin peptidase)/N-methyltransferase [Aquibacillus albus]